MEAWVTSVAGDNEVPAALVLAESLRKAKTSKKVCVVSSDQVGPEYRIALRKVFDHVDVISPSTFCLSCDDHIRPKLFALLSLKVFSKCVYLSPASVVVENADEIFDDDKFSFKSFETEKSVGENLSLFLFKPGVTTWEGIWDIAGTVTFEILTEWMKKQGSITTGRVSNDSVAQFSVKSGHVEIKKLPTHIIQFVDMEGNLPEGLAQLRQRMKLSLSGEVILAIWMEIFMGKVMPVLKNPSGVQSIHETVFKNLNHNFENEPIAIVGMSCRYPGANSLEEFWNLLYNGEEAIREPPAFRWTKDHTVRKTLHDSSSTAAGFLSTPVDEFDARFFGVSPKEAVFMDPQARILHEVMWESLEDAGIDPLSLRGTHTGIFCGSWMNDYKDIAVESTDVDFFRMYMGNGIGATAARLSFLLGLTGPSIATESGCSSAIVALDLAVKSLRSQECNLAIATGVNLILHPFSHDLMNFVISKDGRCKTFDEKADGFGRAEGCGVLVLRRLSEAMRNRDHIWGIIRGSAVSQEGPSKSLGTPTVRCEALAMQLALKDANILPEQVSYVETHGTGTPIGDPMEVAAIARAYHAPNRDKPLIIGSVKTNVGHTESCSGITGIMKVILSMEHELIPKHLNLDRLNPEIFLDSIPASIPMENVSWPKIPGKPRVAGVSSFGITGTDGHVIVQEAPDYSMPKVQFPLERSMSIMKISAKSGEALEELLENYKTLFSRKITQDCGNFSDVCYSANIGRAEFNHRSVLVAENYQNALKILEESKHPKTEIQSQENNQICFLFTGQGSQYAGMGKALYETSPIFRINFDECDRVLQKEYNLSIKPVLWESSEELSRTMYSQVSIFCVEYCLWKLWTSWGIQADYVLGHSLGEFCAAVAAGFLSFADAIKLVAERSRLIDNLPRGKMLVIKESKKQVMTFLSVAKLDLDLAADNTPDQTVVAGDSEKVEYFKEFLKNQGTKSIILEATHAFHSKHMDPMLESYRKVAETVAYKDGDGFTQYISGMEGQIISAITPDYWVRHTREKVSFVDACKAVRETGCSHFLEVGPHPVLSTFVMTNNETCQPACLPSLRRGAQDWQTILTSLGTLYLSGYPVDWKAFDEPYKRSRVPLPFHPLARKSFWVDCSGARQPQVHPLVGSHVNNASSLTIFQNDITTKSVSYLKDHVIGSRIVFPGAGYLEMCLSAGYCMANGQVEAFERPRHAMKLVDFKIDAPMELKEGKRTRVQVIVDLPEGASQHDGYRVKVFHQNTSNNEGVGKWFSHATASFVAMTTANDAMKSWKPDRIAEILSHAHTTASDSIYKWTEEAGLKLKGEFRSITKIWASDHPDESITEVNLPDDHGKYVLHPLVIDAAFQSALISTMQKEKKHKLKVPVRVGQITVFPAFNTANRVLMQAKADHDKFHVFVAGVSEEDGSYAPVALLQDIEFISTNVNTIQSVLEQQSSSIPDAYEEIWKMIPSPFASCVEPLPLQVLRDLPSSPDLQAVHRKSAGSEEKAHFQFQREQLTRLYVLNTFYELGWDPVPNDSWSVVSFCTQFHIKDAYQKLVRFFFSKSLAEYLRLVLDKEGLETWVVRKVPPSQFEVDTEINHLLAEIKRSSFGHQIAIDENLALHYARFLTGEVSPLEVLFPTDENKMNLSAQAYYTNCPGLDGVKDMSLKVGGSIVQASFRINGDNKENKIYRVLEVGAGTGTMTEHLLANLKVTWGNHFELYYTDISKGFFGKAEKRFAQYKDNIKFAVFDLEKSPLSQAIPLGYFDMVVGFDVLHATRSLQETLTHIRQTLRPGGVTNFVETIAEIVNETWIFGLLEGYWRYIDTQTRPHHCCVTPDVWEEVFRSTGYEEFHCYDIFRGCYGCLTAYASPQVAVERLLGFEKPERRNRWLVFVDEDNFDVGKMMMEKLEMSGYSVTGVVRDSKLAGKNVKVVENLEDDTETVQLIEGDGKEKLEGIIYAWGMSHKNRDQKRVALPFLHIAKHLVILEKGPRLFVVTEGVHGGVTEDSMVVNPTAATLFGMAKTLRNENPELFVRIIDVDPKSQPNVRVDNIMYELVKLQGSKEHLRVQVAYRSNLRYEPKFMKTTLQTKDGELKLPVGTERYQLVLPDSRLLQDLSYGVLEEELIEDTEVEVKVLAYALNFKDVLTVIKPSAEFEKLNTIGIDFAGVVTKVGSTSRFTVGERVFGVNNKPVQLPSHLVVDHRTLIRTPDEMTPWEACTLPAVFTTAYHCLINVARMKKGDTVLIHTASGGVGLAAIQLAKQVGAHIIATAGNPRKRSYLRNLGIEHVFHSRDTSYESEILRVTDGRGVDVVLNSITGPGFKEASLNACAKGARFVEMSVLSIWSEDEVRARRPDVDYSIVYLADMNPQEWGELLTSMKEYLEKGQLKPIPYVKFDALNIRQAFQYFQKAKHIGKVVVAMSHVAREEGDLVVKTPLFNADSSYLITGGLGGIGFEVCKWMLANGARNIALNGRRPPSQDVSKAIKNLVEKGANVRVQLGDVGDYDQCKVVIGSFENEKPLRGVMHCAGVLRDNLYASTSWDDFATSFQPKVNGTWNLHDLTKHHGLEHFVVFSSITGLLGAMGQATHTGANCFEDALIHYRNSLGVPGTAVQWGQWAEVGVATEIQSPVFVPVSTQRMLNGLGSALRTQRQQVVIAELGSLANVGVICPMAKGYLHERLLDQAGSSRQSDQIGDASQFWSEMDGACGKEEKMGVMMSYLKNILKTGLRMEPEDTLGDDANLQECGVDSLMMIELKNSLQSLVGLRLAVTANLFKNATTVRLLADAVVSELMEGFEDKTLLEPLPDDKLLDLLRLDSILDKNTAGKGPAPKPSEIKTVLVTGATGQLGAYIVSLLTQNYPMIETIFCLIKTSSGDGAAKEKLTSAVESWKLRDKVDLTKVICIGGNVSKPSLGLPQDIYDNLSSSVDSIFHCAISSNYLEAYRESESDNVRQVNVVGTHNILKFAAESRSKLVYYPSTLFAGLVSDPGATTLPEHWPENNFVDTLVATKIPGLYVTKCVSELLFKQANSMGIPCKVFRFPPFAGNTQTGHINYINNLYILRYLSYLKLGAIPETPMPANFLPVDFCADTSLRLFFNDETPCEVYNVCHPSPPLEQEFVSTAKQMVENGISIMDSASYNNVIEKEAESGSEELNAILRQQKSLMTHVFDLLIAAKGYVISPDTFFHSKNVSKFIPNYEQIIPSVMETIEKDIRYLQSTGVTKLLGIKFN